MQPGTGFTEFNFWPSTRKPTKVVEFNSLSPYDEVVEVIHDVLTLSFDVDLSLSGADQGGVDDELVNQVVQSQRD